MKWLWIGYLYGVFFVQSSFAIETSKNLSLGVEMLNKVVGAPTGAVVQGQYSINALKMLNADVGANFILRSKVYRYNYQYGFSFYPIRLLIPSSSYLPYLGLAKLQGTGGVGMLYKAGLEVLSSQGQGLLFAVNRQVASSQNSTQLLLGWVWRSQ